MDELKNMILENLPEEEQKEEEAEEIQEETQEEPEEESEKEAPEDNSEEEPSKVDRSFQGRINYLVKKQREAEERALAAERALKSKEEEAEKLKQNVELDGLEFDSVDDLILALLRIFRGNIKERLSLAERTFNCEFCGFKIDRDLNAANNLVATSWVETENACPEVGGCRSFRPVPINEAGTEHHPDFLDG